jgi:hypothetical protein
MPDEEGGVFWNLVENPHIPWTYYISGRKRLWPASTMAWVSRYGISTNENILPDSIQNEIVAMFQKARETGFMNNEYTGQMEFWVNPQWEITIFQFRAFREKEEASWDLWQHANDMSYVFWITPQTGEQVTIRTYEDIPYDDYGNTTHMWINLREEYRGKSVNADFPLENMKLILADPRLSPFEHGLYEAAALSDVAIFSILWLPKVPEWWEINLRVFSDWRWYELKIED